MAERIMVRPAEGRRVRLDDGRRLTTANTPPGGESVEWSIYIQRRINCGDLTVVSNQSSVVSNAPNALKPDDRKLETGK
jgi:hypothetical protein